MKTKHAASIITVILIGMMLVTGCASSKLSLLYPGSANQQTNEQNTQQPGAAGISNVNAPVANANESSAVSNPNTNGSNAVSTGSAINPGTVQEPTADTTKTPVKVKALYLTGWTVGSTKRVDHYVELAKNTEINSYVIDIKDDDGYVGYESNVPAVKENGAWKKKYDAD